MKKREEDLLDDDLAAFEEFDAPAEPAFKDEDLLEKKAKPKAPAKEPTKAPTKVPESAKPVSPAEKAQPASEEPQEAQVLDALEFAPDVPIQIVAVLAKKTVSFKDLFELRLGSVVDLGRPPSEYVDLVANGKLIGRGELVEIDGKLGVRIINLRTH